MINKEVAQKFRQLGKIMELHGENPFKIRSYNNAYNTLRKIESPLVEMSHEELSKIKGVGKAIADKILELGNTGELSTYQKYAQKTPPGVIEMLNVRGLGAKKIKVIWEEMEIESIGELLYACNENRLVELKGFGAKTQNQLKDQLQYYIDSKGKYLYGYIIDEARKLVADMSAIFPDDRHQIVGGLRMLDPIVEKIEILTTTQDHILRERLSDLKVEVMDDDHRIGDYPITFHFTDKENYGSELFLLSSDEEFRHDFEVKPTAEEEKVFIDNNRSYIPPELRNSRLDLSQDIEDRLLAHEDIKGVVHSHSTYSDGLHSVEEMARHAEKLGYEYLVMTDHSVSAYYAGGLTEEEVWQQFAEIDNLNKNNPNFRIFKGIEADILSDGTMDYGDDFLQNFEVVIASIHSNLKMDKTKATHRLVKAIENPHTHILGHPTGRLLLSREGYPIDHMKVIDACAANGMIIELNANPLRLDIDWTWIPYAQEKGVMISINPDSHNKESITYVEYGVNVARKGMLNKDMCLNAKSLPAFSRWVSGLK